MSIHHYPQPPLCRLLTGGGALLLLFVAAALLSACGAPVAGSQSTAALLAGNKSVTTGVPTAAVSAGGTVLPPPAEIPGLQGTIVAQATSSPYPTAEPPFVQSAPLPVSRARRGGLLVQLQLEDSSYLAGENGRATVVITNTSRDLLYVRGARVQLLDETDQATLPWPTVPGVAEYWDMGSEPAGFDERRLQPGQSITNTLTFQAPSWSTATGHHYRIVASTALCRTNPQHPDQPDNVWIPLELAPLPIQVSRPSDLKTLKLSLAADRAGYRLEATDGLGRQLGSVAWGGMQAVFGNGSTEGPLLDSANGDWSVQWPSDLTPNNRPVTVRAWAGARGYVAAVTIVALPGERGAEDLGWVEGGAAGPQHNTYYSLDAAQKDLNDPSSVVMSPAKLPQGATLNRVEVDLHGGQGGVYRSVVAATQYYRTAGGRWLLLTQRWGGSPNANEGADLARHDPAAQAIRVGQADGFLLRHEEWLVLDWKAGDMAYELAAPAQESSPAALLDIAAGIGPPK